MDKGLAFFDKAGNAKTGIHAVVFKFALILCYIAMVGLEMEKADRFLKQAGMMCDMEQWDMAANRSGMLCGTFFSVNEV